MVLNFPDQGVRTKVIIDPNRPSTGSAAIFSSSSEQILTNKTIVDQSNVVAASALRNGPNVAYLDLVAPAAGQVLTATSSSVLGWADAASPSLVSTSVYVDVNGSNVTGTGSSTAPFQTISHAMSTITTASPTNRFVMYVGPGLYSNSFSLKANVQIIGAANNNTRIGGAIDLNDASWLDPSGANDNRSGINNCTLFGVMNFNYTTQQSGAGKLFFTFTYFNTAPTFTAYRAINQNRFTSCLMFAGYNNSGCNDLWLHSVSVGGNIALTSNADCSTVTTFLGGVVTGNLTVTYTAANPHTVSASLDSCVVQGTVTVTGASASATATVDSLYSAPVLTSGGTCVLKTPATALAYTPAIPGNWTVPPTTVAAALDMIAAKITPV
jgi:hypothetical protein